MLIPPQVSPANTFSRGEIAPNAGRFFGGQIPVTNRNLWNANGTDAGTNLTAIHAYYSDTTNGQGTYRTRHDLAFDCSEVRLVYCNSGQDPGQSTYPIETPPWASSDIGTQITVHATIEYNFGGGAVLIPVFFGGKKSVTIDEGGFVISDPVNVTFLKSVQAYLNIRTYVQATTSTSWPIFGEMLAASGYSEGYVTNSDLTPIGSGAGFGGQATQAYMPIMILGTVSPRNQVVLGALGDSIMSGSKNTLKDGVTQGNSVVGATNDRSWLDFANGNQSPLYPLVKISRASALVQVEAQSSASGTYLRQTVRKSMLSACTHVFVLYGTNDINNGRTSAQVIADLTTVCNQLKLLGCKVILCTIPPRTTSTDNFATATNQTVSSVSVTGATNASPIVVTTASAHGLADGQQITIAGVTGNTNANGTNYAKETGYSTTTFGLYSDSGLTTPVAGNGTFGGTATVDCRERIRVIVNTWIRSTAQTVAASYGGSLVDYVYDTCAPIEVNASNALTQNGGRWITTGVAKHATPDGIHPSWDGNQTYIATDTALTSLLAGLGV